jgi:hypothetical protein
MLQQMEHQVVSVTLDLWTSKAKQNYAGLTFHYIDDWILRQHDLGCFLHEGKTTATSIKEDYLKKLFIQPGLEPINVEATNMEGKMN